VNDRLTAAVQASRGVSAGEARKVVSGISLYSTPENYKPHVSIGRFDPSVTGSVQDVGELYTAFNNQNGLTPEVVRQNLKPDVRQTMTDVQVQALTQRLDNAFRSIHDMRAEGSVTLTGGGLAVYDKSRGTYYIAHAGKGE
jgi:hypothetical protein